MQHPADHRPTLPTGQDLLFVAGADLDPDAPPRAAVESGLHVCPECCSSLVAPVAWEQAGPREWAVTIECPNCEWWDADVFDEETVERFDEELDRGTEALVRDLKRMMQANMEDEIERFVKALQAGHIIPEDF